jgi:predicted ATPase/cell fate (sporulation/competence/biofilm development) regulator YmcA (YheA/YmcA/DUF963 family)
MSFNFTYNIENLGNIKKASINVKPLTVIAGENSCGKTFITKSLYTFLNTLGTPNYSNELKNKYGVLEYTFIELSGAITSPATIDIEFNEYFDSILDEIVEMIHHLETLSFAEQETIIVDYSLRLNEIFKEVKNYINDRIKLKKFQKIEYQINEFTSSFDDLQSTIDNHRMVTVDKISQRLSEGFKKNFQITKIGSLIRKSQDKKAEINIDTVGNIDIGQKSDINFSFTTSGIKEVHKLSNIVFFDSPIYIKIRKALQASTKSSFYYARLAKDDKYLKGYPEYIEELYEYLDSKYIETPDFQPISDEIQNTISGKLNLTASGDIMYINDDGVEIPLSLAAMGIGNIGTIDMLIRNNIINKGSFLIMDEPEVHLHPRWQVKLADILYQLAKAGANVVIATHSIDLLKALQVVFEENEEEASEYMAFNKMPYSKEFSNLSENDKVNSILDDLSSPYHELYINGLK